MSNKVKESMEGYNKTGIKIHRSEECCKLASNSFESLPSRETETKE